MIIPLKEVIDVSCQGSHCCIEVYSSCSRLREPIRVPFTQMTVPCHCIASILALPMTTAQQRPIGISFRQAERLTRFHTNTPPRNAYNIIRPQILTQHTEDSL